MDTRALSHDDYTVGWICALPLEMAAAELMLDAIHPGLPCPAGLNTYTLGNIGEHNIVIACLPSGAYDTMSSAMVAMQLYRNFSSIRLCLMVGIGSGVPSNNADIRLGDIVVGQPTDTSGGLVQYDVGKALSGGQFKRTGMLHRPPRFLLTALTILQAHHLTENSRVVDFVSDIQAKLPPRQATKFSPPTQEDCLFQADYDHIASDNRVASDTCVNCDRSRLFPRPPREHKEPVIHYGLIGSTNQVIRHGRLRDQLAQDLGVYCVEVEAAGLMNVFPCLVIRGICDYADSHKNKKWQRYAAAVAAAYAKEFLLVVPTDQINSTGEKLYLNIHTPYLGFIANSTFARVASGPVPARPRLVSSPFIQPIETGEGGNSISGWSPQTFHGIGRSSTVPPTDSGYASIAHHKFVYREEYRAESVHDVQSVLSDEEGFVPPRVVASPRNAEDDHGGDTESIYTAGPSISSLNQQNYISELADDLFSKVRFDQSAHHFPERIHCILPRLLKAFAMRFCQFGSTQMHRDIMVFIRRHRELVLLQALVSFPCEC